MKVKLSSKSIKELQKLPIAERKKVIKKLHILENSPLVGKKLQGQLASLFSFKAWPYRIIYQFLPGKKIVYIVTIQHRQSVYG